jgi:RNA repair, ligase-Pnkp-associating, region of Hen1
MLLTLTTTNNPATGLGYLLHKNPAKLHSFELSFGKAQSSIRKRLRSDARQPFYSMSIRWDWFVVSGDSMRVKRSISM